MKQNNDKSFKFILPLLLTTAAILGAYFCAQIQAWPMFCCLITLANIFAVAGMLEGRYGMICRRLEKIEELLRKEQNKPKQDDCSE
jgi:uncharacterized membrane protein YoaK (UPF0700 family)